MTLREKLEERREDLQRWRPEPEDILIGEVKDIREVTTQFGKGKTVEIETEEGVFSLFLSAVLQTKFIQKGVSRGDRVGIKYLGEVTGSSGRRYKDFAVATEDGTPKEEKDEEDQASHEDESPTTRSRG